MLQKSGSVIVYFAGVGLWRGMAIAQLINRAPRPLLGGRKSAATLPRPHIFYPTPTPTRLGAWSRSKNNVSNADQRSHNANLEVG